MKLAYFDCFSGISGDMTIGALVDAGCNLELLRSGLEGLQISGWTISAEKVWKNGMSATHVLVVTEDQTKHRSLSAILEIFENSQLSESVRKRAAAIFRKLGEAEASVHDVAIEKIHFHEVGAVDAIVDIVGACIGFDALGIEKFACSPLNVGGGTAKMAHGILPVPAPATAKLLQGKPTFSNGVQRELVTPTGAAILAAVVDRFEPLQSFATDRIGYGAGTKQFTDFPNCLRLMVGEERELASASGGETVTIIEANIDDMTPQNFGYVTEKLLAAGALDAFTVPVQMKKGRPGHLLQVLARPDTAEALSRIIFQETTTIGIRRHSVNRTTLDREFVEVETVHGRVRIKVSRLDGEIVNFAPEYEDCARIAREKGVPLKRVQSQALAAYLIERKK